MNITEEIKNIIFNHMENTYKNYLQSNKILLIEEQNLTNIINNFYEENNKSIKQTIRSTLREKYKEEYPNASVENILLDIFQDKELNLNKIIDEIKFIQTKNYISSEIPIINNSLNLNISIVDDYVVINSVNNKNIDKQDELYNIISTYKFIYSINDKILDNYKTDPEKINIIKEEIKDKNNVKIGLYYLKKNCNN